MTLTNHPDNRIPFSKPSGYEEIDYELLFRNYEAAKGPLEKMYSYGDPLVPWINSKMPNHKTDTNNQKGFSTDFIGQNYMYPEASYEDRENRKASQKISAGFDVDFGLSSTYTYQVRAIVSQWGTCKDEYEGEDGWSSQLYIREARRMISDYVMTQRNCEKLELAEDAIGLAAYGMDSHHVQRYVDVNGYVKNEGNVEAYVADPFPISFRSIVPKRSEARNLLVPICLSASHIAFGSIRMEPVFMVLGQSAAIAAAMAIDNDWDLQNIPYEQLKLELLKNKQILQ